MFLNNVRIWVRIIRGSVYEQTPSARKATGNHLMSIRFSKKAERCCYARNRVSYVVYFKNYTSLEETRKLLRWFLAGLNRVAVLLYPSKLSRKMMILAASIDECCTAASVHG